MDHNALDDAFRATRYRVALDANWLTLAVGAPCPPALGAWLGRHAGTTPAWLMTAHNPGAQPREPSINNARDSLLRDWTQAHAGRFLDSVNRDPAGRWPDEPGVLMAGVEEGLARSLARRFDQLAMLSVRAHAPVALLWLDT